MKTNQWTTQGQINHIAFAGCVFSQGLGRQKKSTRCPLFEIGSRVLEIACFQTK